MNCGLSCGLAYGADFPQAEENKWWALQDLNL
jgi:hypothetical protein